VSTLAMDLPADAHDALKAAAMSGLMDALT